MSEPHADAGSATGTVHDLGYKRYAGARSSAGTRWRVILRNQIATGWKTWWRFKASLGIAVLVTFIAGGVMFILRDKMIRDFGGNFAATMADAALPKSIEWYTRAAFLVSLTIGARVVAGDMQSGAFTFYFARSVRPRDYVLGKLAGMCALMALIFVAGPLVLSLARLGLSDDMPQLADTLHLVPKALAIGVLGTVAFAAVPLAFSSMFGNVRHAMALWAAYYLVFGLMVSLLGRASHSWIGALDLATALEAVANKVFDLQLFRGRAGWVPWDAALASLLAHTGAAIAILAVQVRRAYGAGVGGAS
ncbi:MAG: ABC transporter permease subunit [Myxococcales bacterium]|nr:ABC transporter permease subunit [Myxococcales bacterium]